MKNEDRIIELLAEMVQKQDQMVANQNITNERLEHIETVENTKTILNLASGVKKISDLDQRVSKLEKTVK